MLPAAGRKLHAGGVISAGRFKERERIDQDRAARRHRSVDDLARSLRAGADRSDAEARRRAPRAYRRRGAGRPEDHEKRSGSGDLTMPHKDPVLLAFDDDQEIVETICAIGERAGFRTTAST